jgi:hypothetical protein
MAHTTRRALILALPLAAAAGAARAHHGWGSYDTGRAFTLAGTITKSSYQNPHCEIEMQAEGKTWRFVLAPPFRMQNRGVTADMIAPGKACTVHGYPHRSDASEARIEYVLLDGKRFELR